jgi:hypothetical protein
MVAGWAFGVIAQSAHKSSITAAAVGSWKDGVINGTVLREGVPVPGVSVMLFGEPSISAKTASDGTFCLKGVPEGPHMVAASLSASESKEWTDRWVPVEVSRKKACQKIELKLVRGALVSGRVLEPNGRPAKSARIAVYHQEPDGKMWSDYATVSETGKFSMRVPSGDWLVEDLPGFGASQTGLRVLSWEQVTLSEGEQKEIILRRMLSRSKA